MTYNGKESEYICMHVYMCVCNIYMFVYMSVIYIYIFIFIYIGFPGGSDGKESTCNAGDLGLFPGLGSSPTEGNGYPLQYSCLENAMDRAAWQAVVHGVTKSCT